MSSKPAPRRKLALGLAGLSLTAIAIACSMVTVPPPLTPVRVSVSDIATHGFNGAARAAIGAALQSMYGNNFRDSEVFVNVPVRGPIGSATVILPFTKPCGETFEEAGEGEEEAPTPPRSGGGGGSPIYLPRIPYLPGGCIGNCGGTVEVGDVEPA